MEPLSSDDLNRRILNLEAELSELKEQRWERTDTFFIKEERYQSIFNSVACSIIVTDNLGNIIDINNYHVDKIGKGFTTKADYLDKNIFDHLGIETAGVASSYANVLQGESIDLKNVYFPSTIGGIDGFFNVRGVPLFHGDQIIGAVFVHDDITYKTNVEQMLHISEEAYKAFIQNSPEGIFVVSEHGKYVEVNNAACQMTGYSKIELLSMNITKLVCPHEQERTLKEFKKLQTIGKISTELMCLKKDGSVFILCLEAVKLSANRFIAFCSDITKRKKAEEELKLSNEKYKQLVQSSPDLVMIHDKRGRIKFINDAGAALFGAADPESIINNPAYKFIHPESLKKLNPLIKKAFAENSSIPMISLTLLLNDGTEVDVEGSGVSINFHGQQMMQVIGRDISYRINAKKEKERLERELNQAHKMEAIGTLAGGIAHDFNNLLSVILGYSNIALEATPASHAAKNSIEEVIRAGNRAKELVKHILSFSRISDYQQLPINIEPIIREALNLIRAIVPTTIDIKFNCETNCKPIMANTTQIHQILLNLCTNASHAMEEFGGTLIVELKMKTITKENLVIESTLTPGEYVKLSLEDTGKGIDTPILDRIFDPYFTTKEIGKGSGMGLSVVHGIVRNHNGAIFVTSKINKGTKFKLYFPIVEKAIDTDKDLTKNLPIGNEHILLVDDEESITELNKLILQSLGYQVTTQIHSVKAVELFCKKPDAFDLIITDQTMPKMTGVQLREEIQAINAKIPIILCTGFSPSVNKQIALDMGFCDYVMKPVDKYELARVVRQALDSPPTNPRNSKT